MGKNLFRGKTKEENRMKKSGGVMGGFRKKSTQDKKTRLGGNLQKKGE